MSAGFKFPRKVEEGNSRRRGNVVFCVHLLFLRSTYIDGWHGYHHSNRLDTLSTKETNCSKNDPLLTMQFEDFQDMLMWPFPSLFFFEWWDIYFWQGAHQFTGTCNQGYTNLRVHVINLTVRCGTLSGHFFAKTSALFKGREFPSSTIIPTACASCLLVIVWAPRKG